jgi:hypothetical protein
MIVWTTLLAHTADIGRITDQSRNEQLPWPTTHAHAHIRPNPLHSYEATSSEARERQSSAQCKAQPPRSRGLLNRFSNHVNSHGVLHRFVRNAPSYRADFILISEPSFCFSNREDDTQRPNRRLNRHSCCSRTVRSLIKIKDRPGPLLYKGNRRQPNCPARPARDTYFCAARTKEIKPCRRCSLPTLTNCHPACQYPCTDNGEYF